MYFLTSHNINMSHLDIAIMYRSLAVFIIYPWILEDIENTQIIRYSKQWNTTYLNGALT